MSDSCGPVALCWGTVPPVFSIGWEAPTARGDSGYSVLFDDAPDPDELSVPDGEATELPAGLSLVCLNCLIEDHPEIGRGLDLAREFGAADLDEAGVWVGRGVDEGPAA